MPRTPLWDRLAAAGRLKEQGDRESNVDFLRPYEDVVEDWHRCVRHAYAPEAVYARFAYNAEHTFPNRIKPPVTKARLNAANIRKGLTCLVQPVPPCRPAQPLPAHLLADGLAGAEGEEASRN